MAYGVVQGTLYASNNQLPHWTLPVLVAHQGVWLLLTSKNQDSVLASHRPAVLHSRIAKALGIENNDELEFELATKDNGGDPIRLKMQVTVANGDDDKCSSIPCDLFLEQRCLEKLLIPKQSNIKEGQLVFKDGGRQVALTNQELWVGRPSSKLMGGGILYFAAARRDNTKGVAGAGFTFYSSIDTENRIPINLLVKGHVYLGGNNKVATSDVTAEYLALLEGLTWAMRFDLRKIWICGSSELVVNQLNGTRTIHDDEWQPHHSQIAELVTKAREHDGKDVEICHVARHRESGELAKKAISSRQNATLCNWVNINKQSWRDLPE